MDDLSSNLPRNVLETLSKRPQFNFIDGLRALCALYIVLHHTVQTIGWRNPWVVPFRFGFEVVVIFITISGFCLALPLASRDHWQLNVTHFYWKRARRILPPYYAAVAIGLLIVLISALFGHAEDYLETPFSLKMLWSHLALVQNWIPSQTLTLDGPLWSIALECQIYLLFPGLVFLRLRLGRWLAFPICAVAAILLIKVTHAAGFDGLLFMFTMGVLGADLAYLPSVRRWLLPCALLCLGAVAVIYSKHVVMADDLLGLAVALLMAYCVQTPRSSAHRILGWKPLAWVGTFSYSIYLLHSYTQILAVRWLNGHRAVWPVLSANLIGVILLCLLPLIVWSSYWFHVAFERPFMGKTRQSAEQHLAPAVVTKYA